MQRFTPNTVLHDRFLLKEELSFDSQAGQQFWAVQDRQTGQALVALLHADGRVEWFNDNRSPVSAPPVVPVVTRQAPKPAAPLVAPKPAPTPVGKRAISFLAIMLLVGGLIGGYFYRKPLLAYVQSLRSIGIVHGDSATQTNSNRTASATGLQSGALPTWEPATSSPASTATADTTTMVTTEATTDSGPASAPISDRQALRMLNLLRQIPAEKHPAIFTDARQAFAELRQTFEQQAYIDSLYTMCMGHGAQSFLIHQQNGDAASKQYAIEWYQLAYALKPSAVLQGRLDRLKNITRSSPIKHATTSKKSRESLFIADPEVNN